MSDEIDHEYTSKIVCPHCGYAHKDSCEFFDNGGECVESECWSCDKPMVVTRHVSIKYSTRKTQETTR